MPLYENLGGSPAVEAAVELFLEKVLADDALQPIFAEVDVGSLKAMQRKFLTKAFGGPDAYDGRSLRQAHRGKGITNEHFAAVAGHLSATLKELGVAVADHDEAMAIAASTKPDIVELDPQEPLATTARTPPLSNGLGSPSQATVTSDGDGNTPERSTERGKFGVDVKRLEKHKQDQRMKLQRLRTRVDKLAEAERLQHHQLVERARAQASFDAQAEMRRRAQEADHRHAEISEKTKADALRARALEMKRQRERASAPQKAKFQDNQEVGRQIRQQSKQLQQRIEKSKEMEWQCSKLRCQAAGEWRVQQKLRRENELKIQSLQRDEVNTQRYNELVDEIERIERSAVSAAGQEESAVQRLQHSREFGMEVVSQLQAFGPSNGELSSATRQDIEGKNSAQPRRRSPRAVSAGTDVRRPPRSLGQIEEEAPPTMEDVPAGA